MPISRRRLPWCMAVVVFTVTLACYWPALHGTPIWDDAAHITRPDLRSWAGLGRIWTELGATQQYYPVLHSAFWIEYRLWGEHPLGYHLLNVLLHAGSACLLAILLGRLWRENDVQPQPGRAGETAPRVPAGVEWIAALLLAVHPVAVESVAWISEQKNTLSLFLSLLSALAYLRFDRTRRPGAYVLATALFLLALGTKTVTATLPAALFVVLWWKRGRLAWRRDALPLTPWLFVGAAAGLATAWVERTAIGAHGVSFALSASDRLLLACRNIWFYLGKLVWPRPLMFVYPRWDVAADALRWLPAVAATAVVTLVLWAGRRLCRGPLAAWLVFVGVLFPALGFFNVYPFLFSYVADHFQYHASVAVFAVMAAGAGLLLRSASGAWRRALVAAMVVALAALGMLAHAQSGNYRDSDTLYRRTLALNPACWFAHNNLGEELSHDPARLPEAIAHYRTAIEIEPDFPEAHNNLGVALAGTGRLTEAMAELRTALRIAPEFGEARLNLANTLARLPGEMPAALREYAETLRRHPDYAAAHFCLANTLAPLPGRRDEAIQEFEQALRLSPGYVEAHENLAMLLGRDPRTFPLAVQQYEAAIRLAPDRARTHYNLAVLLDATPGHEQQAMAEYRAALRLAPSNAAAHNNLGILYVRLGSYAEARREWEAALECSPDFADARRNLALLQQRLGK